MMATLRFQRLNERPQLAGAAKGLAGQYANVVKDDAHGAMPASEFNLPGASKTAPQGMLRAGFQPGATLETELRPDT